MFIKRETKNCVPQICCKNVICAKISKAVKINFYRFTTLIKIDFATQFEFKIIKLT